MAGFVRAVALDLDGTLTDRDRLSGAAMAGVDAARDDGLTAILVTGRTPAELEQTFSGIAERFDAVVAENGTVLAVGGIVRDLAPAVEPSLTDALAERRARLAREAVHDERTPNPHA